MPPRFRADPTTDELREGFERIRRELEIPDSFSRAALDEADRASTGPVVALGKRDNRTDLPLVTIDPPGARDLDQAVAIEARTGGGWRVWYAIADVAAFVIPGGAVDVEAHRRGVTYYSPDERAPLYPEAVGEAAASLLPDAPRPALLWRHELDGDGAVVESEVRRAVVHSRAQLTYQEVQGLLDAGDAPPAVAALGDVGRARLEQERLRGGVDLDLPDQEVILEAGRYELAFRRPLPVESWNAQVSLLTGMAAAALMERAGIGLVRTLPPPPQPLLDAIRRSAATLGHPWRRSVAYPDFVRDIDRSSPTGAALVTQIARTFRGAGYAVVQPGEPVPRHAAVAAPYAHVTAPLRRLADRHVNEVVLAVCDGRATPPWAVAELAALPDVMVAANRRAADLHRAHVDFAEAMALRARVGEVFDAAVTDAGDRRGAVIQLREPAVLARLEPGATVTAGSELQVRLTATDPLERRVVFEPA